MILSPDLPLYLRMSHSDDRTSLQWEVNRSGEIRGILYFQRESGGGGLRGAVDGPGQELHLLRLQAREGRAGKVEVRGDQAAWQGQRCDM